MTVEVTGYSFNDGVVSIFATDCSEEHLMWLERTRDDRVRELEFQFDTTQAKPLADFSRWIHSQPRVKETEPDTWGNACRAVLGTVTNLNGKYLVWE